MGFIKLPRDWSFEDRLRLINEIVTGLIGKRHFTIPQATRKALLDVSLIATQPSASLEAQRERLLKQEYIDSRLLNYLKTGQQFLMVTVHRSIELLDGSKLCRERNLWVTLNPGTHKFERIKNPWPRTDSDFFVLCGTKIGLAESALICLSEEDSIITITDDSELEQAPP